MAQLCRTCHVEVTTGDYIVLNNNNNINSRRVKSQLLSCVPELQQDLVKDPVLCSSCVDALSLAYAFKVQCLQTEKRIRKYFENANLNAKSLTLVELYKEVGVTYNLSKVDDSTVKSTNNDDEGNDANDLIVKQEELPYVKREDVYEDSIEESGTWENVSSNANADVNSEDVGNVTCDNDLENEEIVKEEHDITQFKIEEMDFKKNDRSRDIKLEKLPLLALVDESLQIKRAQQFENSVGFGGLQDLPPGEPGNALITTFSPTRSANQCESTQMELSTNENEQRSLITENLASNVVIDAGKKLYGCNVCEFRATIRSNLKSHMRTHTGEKPFACTICEFRSAYRIRLSRHMIITHKEEAPFRCNVCEFRSTQWGKLKSHMKTHTDKKPFRCNICEYWTREQSNLNKHIKTHSEETPFRCTICDFRSTRRDYLKLHMRTHGSEKPFRCTICEFRTRQQSNLNLHFKTHNEEKTFQCIVCEFRTKEQSYLKQHMKRIHSVENQFRCTICDFGSTRPDNLKSHMRIHTGEKPFRCTIRAFHKI